MECSQYRTKVNQSLTRKSAVVISQMHITDVRGIVFQAGRERMVS